MKELKERERVLLERNVKGCYICKVRHVKLYKEMTEAMAPYIPKDRLIELQHDCSTQKNEAMNTSLLSVASKHKYYSGTT